MSLGHLCLILLVDLIIGAVTLPVDLTTLLLHTVLILWDHRMEVVRDQAREMLLHLIHQLVVLKTNDELTPSQSKSIEDFIELIRLRDSKVIWKYEDNNGRSSDFDLVEPMTFVIKEVVSIFSIPYPGIEAAWGRVTMNWATICPVRHLACRSLQIYRCLLKPLDATVVSGLLSRLGISLGDETIITQTYSMDILRTLRTIVMSLNSESLTLLPPLFWTTWTCLGSTNEAEYMEALEMLDVMLEKKFLDDPATVTALDESKPANVDWAADSLITLVTQGARSATTMGKCLTVLQKLIQMPFRSHFVGHTKGFLLTILAHLPHMAHYLQYERADKQIVDAARILADVANQNSYDTVSRIFKDFATSNVTNSQDLLTQCTESLRFYFFPGLEVIALKFLVGLLNNSQTWFKAEVLQILEIIISPMDLHKQEIMEHGVDLLAPLLRLLNTELAGSALKVLDHFTEIPGTKLHQQQLRVSITATTSFQDRRRFERTESLYGIPETSGWSIPKPAIRRESLRRDMLAIHDAFMGDATVGNNGLPTPGLVFYKEDRLYGSYFPEQSTAMSSVEVHLAETNVGELVDKLEALDDFFEESDATETGSQYYSHSPRAYDSPNKPLGYIRHGPYDSFSNVVGFGSAQSSFNSTSSARSPSHSFNNGNSNGSLRTPHLAEPIVMSPSAFKPPKAHAHALAHLHIRPELQPRTLSSPGPQQSHFHHRTPPSGKVRSSGDEAAGFSEDEVLSSASGSSSVLEQKMRFSKGSFRGGIRSGLRRLTGGTEGRSRVYVQEREGSPEVPKVPEKWRN